MQYELYVRYHVNFTHTLMNTVQAQSWYYMTVDGGTRKFNLLRGHLTVPVHPRRAVDIGTIVSDADLGAFPMLWLIVTEDGLFPHGDHTHAKLIPLFYGLGKNGEA